MKGCNKNRETVSHPVKFSIKPVLWFVSKLHPSYSRDIFAQSGHFRGGKHGLMSASGALNWLVRNLWVKYPLPYHNSDVFLLSEDQALLLYTVNNLLT